LYNVYELDAPAYQDEKCCEDVRVWKGVSDNICAKTLTRDDEEDNMIEAAEIASMAREQTTTVFDDSEDDEVDDTLMAYCSGSEEDQDVDSDDEWF
jgi:hypothetical protein